MNTFHAHNRLRFTPKTMNKVSSYDFSSKRSDYTYPHQYDLCNKISEMKKSIVTSDSGDLSPGLNDVLCGRGSAANNHIGNIRFRDVVKKYQDRYRSACKSDKPIVALEIVLRWKSMSPPGRFLSKKSSSSSKGAKDNSEDVGGGWYEIPDEQASRKVAQRLRERSSAFAASQLRRREREVNDVVANQTPQPPQRPMEVMATPMPKKEEVVKDEQHQGVSSKSSLSGPRPLGIATATSSLDSFLKGISTIDTTVDTTSAEEEAGQQDSAGMFSLAAGGDKDVVVNKNSDEKIFNMYTMVDGASQIDDSLPSAADLTTLF